MNLYHYDGKNPRIEVQVDRAQARALLAGQSVGGFTPLMLTELSRGILGAFAQGILGEAAVSIAMQRGLHLAHRGTMVLAENGSFLRAEEFYGLPERPDLAVLPQAVEELCAWALIAPAQCLYRTGDQGQAICLFPTREALEAWRGGKSRVKLPL